jgi:hypothetical protein
MSKLESDHEELPNPRDAVEAIKRLELIWRNDLASRQLLKIFRGTNARTDEFRKFESNDEFLTLVIKYKAILIRYMEDELSSIAGRAVTKLPTMFDVYIMRLSLEKDALEDARSAISLLPSTISGWDDDMTRITILQRRTLSEVQTKYNSVMVGQIITLIDQAFQERKALNVDEALKMWLESLERLIAVGWNFDKIQNKDAWTHQMLNSNATVLVAASTDIARSIAYTPERKQEDTRKLRAMLDKIAAFWEATDRR